MAKKDSGILPWVLFGIVVVVAVLFFTGRIGGKIVQPSTEGTPITQNEGSPGTAFTCWTDSDEIDPESGKPFIKAVPCTPGQTESIFGSSQNVKYFRVKATVAVASDAGVTYDWFNVSSASPQPPIYDAFKNGAAIPANSLSVAPGSSLTFDTYQLSTQPTMGCSVNELTCDAGETEKREGTGIACKCVIPIKIADGGVADFETMAQPVAFSVNVKGKYVYGNQEFNRDFPGTASVQITADPTGGASVNVLPEAVGGL